ncbi:MAG: 16S rRNA (cytosine(967)-C(5))-methyltransferase RsmB [Gemmatimonadota bacterium]
MKGITEGRRAALELLRAVERGRRLDVAWEELAPRLPAAERPWVQEAAYGAVRFRGRLDHLLELHVDRGLERLDPALLPILRLGAYQLLHMDGVPSYAAVSQAVEQAREVRGGRVGGFVNAVLRALLREGCGEDRFPSLEEDPESHLTTWGSHPRWMVRRWLERYGVEDVRDLVAANNRVPSTWFVPIGVEPHEAARRLGEAGIRSEAASDGSGALRLPPGTSPQAALGAAPGIVQDPAARWVVLWTGDVAGRRSMDLCAAPGGKAVGLAGRGAQVVAADRSPGRLRRLRQTADRLNLRIACVAADAHRPPFRRGQSAEGEVVLVDAPCSGTGTLARHPDARWRLTRETISELAEVQGRLLDGAAGIVRPGGLLVYSTCTLEPEENDSVVEAFLARHPEFIVEGGPAAPDAVRDGSILRILPHVTGTDGSFAARLRRQTAGHEAPTLGRSR